ncbi:MAG: BamA/TamA family outer membrane protein [Chitinophagaceae bacterium]|nr:BamA/TamA family outer membrane protein [Chitinophagaceae bacterium]
MMFRKAKYFYLLISCAIIGSACNNLKKIPAGDALYTGATVKIDSTELSKKKKKSLEGELHSLVRPKPNKKILGMRFKLSMYNLAGNPKKENSLRGWIKNKLGEPPVLLSDVNLERNVKVLQSTLENTGYFQAQVEGDTTIDGKTASAQYRVQTGIQYKNRNILFDTSGVIQKAIAEDSSVSLLKKGDPFDLGVVKGERVRIDGILKEKGYYFFDPNFLIVQTDTTAGNNQVDLKVKIKPGLPPTSLQAYTVNDIFFFPTFRPNAVSGSTNPNANVVDTSKKDMVFHDGYYVLDRQNQYKPRIFEDAIQFHKGELYNSTDHSATVSRLVNLGLFRFVRNRLEPVPGDSAKLNVYYYMTPMQRQSLRAEINGSTKSNNLTGSSVTLGWRKRNTFHGGELLSIDATGGFEVQVGGQLRGYNTFRYGLRSTLSIPRFIVPFIKWNNAGGFVPRTEVSLGFEKLIRNKLYTMNSFQASYGYIWKTDIKNEQKFNPIAITYVQPASVSQQYTDSVKENPILGRTIAKQFILGATYNYNYSELQDNIYKTGIYFNGNADISGNIIGLITGASENNPKSIFGAEFSQYIRLEADFRYYFKLAKWTVLANRIILGGSVPYGNSRSLPFVKQFFAGGNNSLRGFRSRSVGPGTYASDTISTGFLPDQPGDMKLELNTELRTKLFSIVHGAIFIDAGNVWLAHEDTLTGAGFSKSFLKELAVDAGVGLRFDASFLVLRLDLAFPLRKPFLPEGDRWVLDEIKFGSGAWRRQNLIFNIGIGYPF